MDDYVWIDDSHVCRCVIYEEDEKNQKILVGYGSLAAETSVLTPIPRNRGREVLIVLPTFGTETRPFVGSTINGYLDQDMV